MNIQEYIESGVLEEYCMGALPEEEQSFVIQMSLLYPEVKQELTHIELALEKLANANAVAPSAALKHSILTSLGFVDGLDLENLPTINKDADHQLWLEALKHLIPAETNEDLFCYELRNNNLITQTLVVSKVNIPVETHEDVIESFLILKGICECTVGNEVFRLSTGDFIEIPLHINHDIRILTPYVVAVLQHQTV